MRRFLAAFALALLAFIPIHPPQADAQTVNLWCYTGPTNPQWQPCSTANPLAVNASVSASITGFPGSTQTTGTPIAVTTGGVTGTLPAGTVVVASNVGTTNNAYCKLGASATTSDQLIAPSSWFGFTVGSNTQLTCITSTSTTTVNMVGGSGLPTGAGGGGGSGGGGGGAITAASGSYAAGAFSAGVAVSGSWLDGSIVTLGAKADAHSCSAASAIACLGQIDDDVKGPVQAGTNIIGKVGIDQTTAGTTNGISIIGVNAATALAGAGAVGTGAQRVAVGQDTTTIAGAAPGTAGTASANVITVQGVASMTKLLVTPDANSAINVAQVNGVTALTGTGATGTGAQRVTVSTDQATNAGAALVTGGVGVVNGASVYQTEPASTSITALTGGGGGATGDYLSHCTVVPTTVSPGVFTITDNATAIYSFPGGTNSLSNLVPWTIPVGAKSASGAWKVTTGAGLSIVCVGKFT
jgi:hypothetical protein